MNKLSTIALAAIVPMAMATPVAAKTVFKAAEVCYKVGVAKPGDWQDTLKIKPQQALTDKRGAIVEVVGLVHGAKALPSALNYYNPLVGSAAYNPDSEEVLISLTGSGAGNGSAAYEDIHGLWMDDFALNLPPLKATGLRILTGYETFKPTAQGHENDPATVTVRDAELQEISCKDF